MSTYRKNFALLTVLLVAFIDWMGISLVYPMFSAMLFRPDIHLLPATATAVERGFWLGVLLAAMPIAQFFSSPIIGTLSDQKGRKPLLKITLFICLIGYFLCAVAVWWENLALLFLARIIIGIGAGNSAVVSAALADVSAPEEKVKNFGLLNMAYGIGFTIGPFLGGKLSDKGFASWASYDKPFLLAGLLVALNLLLLAIFFKETHLVKREAKANLISGLKNLKKAFHLREIRFLFLSVFAFCFGWSFFWEFIPIYWMKEFSLSLSQIGNFYAYGAGFYALSCGVLIRPIANRIRAPVILLTGLVLLSLFIFVMLFNAKVERLWILIPFQQYLLAFLFPTATAMVSNWVKEDAQGEMMGVLQSVISFAFALSPLLSGFLVGLSHEMPILAGGSVILLGAILLGWGCFQDIFRKSPYLQK